MPLRGGASDKSGNRYEGRWTVLQLIRILDGEADTIRLEDPTPDGDGVEFWIKCGGVREFHQVKRQIGGKGRWTLAELRARGVLSHFWDKLQNVSDRCVFASMHAADQLDELAEHARDADTYGEYYKHFLVAHGYHSAFDELLEAWGNCPAEKAFDALKRVNVETIHETTLKRNLESLLAMRFDAEPASVSALLSAYVLDNVHHRVTAHAILHHLQTVHHVQPRHITPLNTIVMTVQETTERYLSSHAREFLQPFIPRQEIETILSLLQQDNSQRLLIMGAAGIGKSAIVVKCVKQLRDQGWPVLALRVDRLEVAVSPQDIGQSLYQRRESPTHLLAAIAQGEPCLLVIDQLDAISLASGRRPEIFDVIREIIEQASNYPNMRVLLSCRSFDLVYDYRLRALMSERDEEPQRASVVEIAPLAMASVDAILAEWGISIGLLSTQQKEMLRTPLHLRLFREIAQKDKSRPPTFHTVNDLYAQFWSFKEEMIRARQGQSVQFAGVIYALTAYMSDNQRLTAPIFVVDALSSDAKILVSEHVLIDDSGHKQYAFFHEGFFDYAFARHFVAERRPLAQWLFSSEQHLFRRAQVRQILTIERDDDRAHYYEDLENLMNHSDIRFHLKQIAIAFLGTLADPAKEEWEILAPFVDEASSPCRREILLMVGQPSWFRLLDRLGVWQRWLDSETLVDATIAIFKALQAQEAERIAELISGYVNNSEWTRHLKYLMFHADFSISRKFFDIFLEMIDNGAYDDQEQSAAFGHDFWLMIYGFPGKKASWACEAIGHFLKRRATLSFDAGHVNPFRAVPGIPDSSSSHGVLALAAQGDPEEFVHQTLPLVLKILRKNPLIARRGHRRGYIRDNVWTFRVRGSPLHIHDEILSGLEAALSILAEKEDLFSSIAAQLQRENFETAHYLLMKAYTTRGEKYADFAMDYLCNHPDSLRVDADYGVARQLIGAISPYCSQESLGRLEHLLLSYHPSYERTRGRDRYGYAQWLLLEGIDPSRKSPSVHRKLARWQRKFGQAVPPAPLHEIGWYPGATLVQSPISADKASKFDDNKWLEAINQYRNNEISFSDDSPFIGGAEQFSHVLEGCTKNDPGRFARLGAMLPDDAYVGYFEAILRGITGTNITTSDAIAFANRCHQLPGRPCGRWLCRFIASLADRSLPEVLLGIVAWYATEDLDPQQETWQTPATSDGTPYYGGDIDTAGINSTRGSAAEAIGALIAADQTHLTAFLPTLEHLIQDSSLAVRACTTQAIRAVALNDRDRAVALFVRLCQASDELLKSDFVIRLLRPLLYTHFAELSSILDRLIASDDDGAAMAGARIATLVAFAIPEAQNRVDACLFGSPSQRFGVTQVYAANILRYGTDYRDRLIHLFDDHDPQVCKEAATCFHGLESDDLAQVEPFVVAFIGSSAFVSNPFHLLHALERSTARLSDTTCQACERLLDTVETSSDSSVRERYAAIADTAALLVLRLYSQTTDSGIHSRCLNLLDRILMQGYPPINDQLSNYER